jgi:hypothetical protein
MVMGAGEDPPSHRTTFPNLFIAGDTVSQEPTLDIVIEAAFAVAGEIK